MADERLNKLAKLLVNYSVNVKKGDKVFVSCNEVAAPWLTAVVKEAAKAGGVIDYQLTCQNAQNAILKYSDEEQLKTPAIMYESVLKEADVWLSAWGARNTKINANIPSEKLKASMQGAKSWRKYYSERMGDGSLRWCGTQFPTESDAQEANMSLEEYEDFVYGAGLIDKDDPVAEWKKISAKQDRWVEYLNAKSEIHVVSEKTDITASVKGRKWINCDGKVNFPDGEIFTTPIEDSVNGHIRFSFPGIYAGKEIEGIELTVKNGRVVEAKAEKGQELLDALLETDEGVRTFGELAIGTNYGIKKFTKNMLFDEKIGGTVHMALGDSFPEAGGKNKSSVHWDMLCDMRNGGRIYADGELFYKDGRFIDEVLK